MRRLALISLVGLSLIGCKEEEPPPTFPPEIPGATVDCADMPEQDFPVVQEVGVEITDPDGDLLSDSLVVTVNGLLLEEVVDDDADDVYTWSPPTTWDPPMICTGTFQIIVEAQDAEGHQIKQTIEVDKSS